MRAFEGRGRVVAASTLGTGTCSLLRPSVTDRGSIHTCDLLVSVPYVHLTGPEPNKELINSLSFEERKNFELGEFSMRKCDAVSIFLIPMCKIIK